MMGSFMVCTPSKVSLEDQIKEDKCEGPVARVGGKEKSALGFGGET
jgi:hypothetical protein